MNGDEEVVAIQLPDGYAFAESNESEADVLLFWSDAAYARRCIQPEYPEGQTTTISLFDFTFRWLPGMNGIETVKLTLVLLARVLSAFAAFFKDARNHGAMLYCDA